MSDEHRTTKRRPWWHWALAAVGTAAFIVLLIWGPWWIEGHHLHDNKGRLVSSAGIIVTGFRTMLVAIAAGGFTAAGLYYTREKHQLERDQFKHAQEQFAESQKQYETTLRETQARDAQQVELTREGQVTERYVEAINLLASDNLHRRLGGIYSLERIMRDSEKDHEVIVEVLATYVRTDPSRIGGVCPDDEPEKSSTITEDVQAAIAILARRPQRGEKRRVNLAFASLRKAKLRGGQLVGCDLQGATLAEADAVRADMSKAKLRAAHLCNADMSDANLAGADLAHACLSRGYFSGINLHRSDLREAACVQADFSFSDLTSAVFRGADMSSASLQGADLTEAKLGKANLEDANLTHAKLKDAVLHEVNFRGANLRWAHGLTASQVEESHVYETTRLPPELAAMDVIKFRIKECEEFAASGQKPPAVIDGVAGLKAQSMRSRRSQA